MLPVAEYPHQEPYPGAPKLKDGLGCSAQGLGVANYAGLDKAYLVGDWCSGRLFGIAWDKGANKWQMQELLQASLQFTAGQVDEDGTILATNCYCFYTSDKGPTANPAGALWRVVAGRQGPERRRGARRSSPSSEPRDGGPLLLNGAAPSPVSIGFGAA